MSYNPLHYRWISKTALENLKTEADRSKAIIANSKLFIDKLASGKLTSQYTAIDEQDELGLAFKAMQAQLLNIAKADVEKNWSSEGMAKFIQILRSDSDNLSLLADKTISQLVKYLDANQGALFILNDEHADDIHLHMLACYAYERKKYIHKKISPGEGLVGQSLLEKDTIYITDIPKNYTHITSGLGHATPREILIVPLKNNDSIMGIVELASFNKFEPYQISFIEKLGESIANTFSVLKINEITKKLLAESQKQAEEMKTQEEELLQNLEELSSIQESQSRLEKELKLKLAELEQAKLEIESIRKEEAAKTTKQIELQNKIMSSTVAKFKAKEEEMMRNLLEKDEIIRMLSEKSLMKNQN